MRADELRKLTQNPYGGIVCALANEIHDFFMHDCREQAILGYNTCTSYGKVDADGGDSTMYADFSNNYPGLCLPELRRVPLNALDSVYYQVIDEVKKQLQREGFSDVHVEPVIMQKTVRHPRHIWFISYCEIVPYTSKMIQISAGW